MTADERGDRQPQHAPQPEAGGRLLIGWILIALAAVMVFAGWLGVSANPQVAVQLSYLVSGGVGGLHAGIVGIGLLVSDDIRKDRARIGRLEAAVLEMRDLVAAQALSLAAGDGAGQEEGSGEAVQERSQESEPEALSNGRVRAAGRRR